MFHTEICIDSNPTDGGPECVPEYSLAGIERPLKSMGDWKDEVRTPRSTEKVGNVNSIDKEKVGNVAIRPHSKMV
jgi:hypothetical protein